MFAQSHQGPGSRSLTKFKVENKNSRHVRTLTLKYLSAVF